MASAESILRYGSASWTAMKVIEKKLHGYYTKMLCMAFNVSYQDKLTKKELYGIYHPYHQKRVSEG